MGWSSKSHQHHRRAAKQQTRCELLASIWLFEACGRRELESIAELATPIQVSAGRVLIHEGEVGQEFLVLARGSVEVTLDGKRLATLDAGTFFGEVALLDGLRRSATVTARSDALLLVMNRWEFAEMMQSSPAVSRRMLKVMGGRLRSADDGEPTTEHLQVDEAPSPVLRSVPDDAA